MNKTKILIGLAIIALLSSCGSDPYEVEREITVNTPASEVYKQVINHKNRVKWSPWSNKDPEMSFEFEGAEEGVGAIYKWSGNDEVGTGSLTIKEVRENEYVQSDLEFTEPWESKDKVEWEFKEVDGSTNVVWKTSGELPKMASMFMDETMDEMLGPDFEQGLKDLKAICENNYVAPEPIVDSTTTDSLEM